MVSKPPRGSDATAARFAVNLRRIELRRMRWLAGGLLLLMLILFVATSIAIARMHWPWLAYVHAFTEAAMVGACADWFAVVALFRHPFGVPLPHTAVIARHKVRIGESFGAFVASNFLTPAEVTGRLEAIDAAGWAARWIRAPEHAAQVADRLQHLFPLLLDSLGSREVRDYSLGLVRKGIDSIAAAPLLGRLLSVLVARGHHEATFDTALDRAQDFIDAHQDNIRRAVSGSSARWVPGWVDDKVTDAFLAELQKTIDAAREDPGHVWRRQYRGMLDGLMTRLADDPQLLEEGERIKAEVLDGAVLDGYLEWLGTEAGDRLQVELAAREGVLQQVLARGLAAAGEWLDTHAEVSVLVNRWAQQLVYTAIVPNRSEIGGFISGVVARWDTATLIDKLELQVGKDLQFIRINGTLIGGLVGLGIFVAERLLS
ncbi:DUF445 domain-containing protein [Burkholderia sp. Ax-1724]|uniref:DUF445 domain-containing protein n=2 Tax=Burkholderiaceae TaxID=119060 RepID=UPI001422F1A1|nr:DUF445 domain-containing protein [Burkholderia sp. Ax-1724]NIF56474.1 DUF445 domain-containing protein [Burkholderia sp. Ax-1724]